MNMLSIDLQQVSLSYPARNKRTEVLKDIQLRVTEGEFISVLGPSGCGKTSLLRLIAGYERPTSGEVHIFGRKHTEPNADVGVVFQHANLFPWLNVRSNVEFGLVMRGLSKAERRAAAAYHIEQVGLTPYASMLPYQLSGGMKQRTAIARSLVMDPRLILMDEPFAALDAITREGLQAQLRSIWLRTGKTIFFITHDVDEALLLSSRILVMNGSSESGIMLDFNNPLHSGTEASLSQGFSHIRKHHDYAELRESLVQALRVL
ncbi:ABC transporter ATP-binding protein [Paenibacillus eucommiae]|uniref:NitT/TauT family transport system ATP-binding protein/taurine transport system ATP-binding protein n=1 Tax=Paenibacillus eucommiae TaxID=1355755 RepID=A0ABS4J7P5_9BACL|nr:ABC transporter ATP-binding protein [Paenibacillus eucommiae]MBP1995852.1 NitT/TauT family transport system ATP-binding protein/taurine transport system ATP-binding protein [Paenibacillus eucommiae]